ncbi:DUF2071 domain-containing protein [Brevibacterium ammoniilyticum]|uniref:DUF2071 domain-containing protein n=2 Tax=Brevibacterium ammoniilyticum TaxID=1046555 RepID=A0ABP9TWK8_9MICO
MAIAGPPSVEGRPRRAYHDCMDRPWPKQRIDPSGPPLPGREWIAQEWNEVVFLHWRVDAAFVDPLLPAGTRADVLDDGESTWVGLVCFRCANTHFPPLGRAGRLGPMGDFIEVNVRVYTVDEVGRRSVVFLSLDASRLPPVIGARLSTGLPYWWSAAAHRVAGESVSYTMTRRGTALGSRVSIDLGDPITEPGRLEAFLTARWGMHIRHVGGTYFMPNTHEPWSLRAASVTELDDDLVTAAGLPDWVSTQPPDSVLYSPGVTARFSLGRRLSPVLGKLPRARRTV